MRKQFLIILLLAGALHAGLSGQDPVFKASAPSQVQVGRQFQFTITGNDRAEIRFGKPEAFSILQGPYTSYSSSTQIINGKMARTENHTYTYMLMADKAGEHSIPPLTVKVGRKEYKTNAVKISVVSATSASSSGNSSGNRSSSQQQKTIDEYAIRIQPEKREVYVGEQFVSDLRLFFRVNPQTQGIPKISYEGFYKIEVDRDESSSQVEFNGYPYHTQVIQRHILIPQRSGTLTIPVYESEWFVQERVQNSNSMFNDPFFDRYRNVPVKIYTRPVELKVKPLPEGAPEGFTGAVGDFSMQASLSSDQLEVNDALSLKVTVKGSGNLNLLGEPQVKLPRDHDLYEVTRKTNTSTTGNRLRGSVTFDYPIVVRHAGSYRIPPIKFSWFDPESETYQAARSEGFEFRVLKGEQEGEGIGSYIPGVSQEQVRDLGKDIRDIRRNEQQFRPLNHSLMASRWYGFSYLSVFLIFIISAYLLAFVARRNADISLVRNRQAGKEARKRLRKADRYRKNREEEAFYDEISRSLWLYLENKMSVDKTVLSMEQVTSELLARSVGKDLISDLKELLESSEFARFAPASQKPDMDEMYGRAVELINKLEKTL